MGEKLIQVASDYSRDNYGPSQESSFVGWADTFNQSRSAGELVAAGYTLNLRGGAGSITEDGSSLSVVMPVNEVLDWWPGAYNSYTTELTLPANWKRVWLSYNRIVTDNTGVFLAVRYGADGTYSKISSSTFLAVSTVQRILTDNNGAGGFDTPVPDSLIGWLCVERSGNWLRLGYNLNAWVSMPGWNDWIWVDTEDKGNDDPFDIQLLLGVLNVTGGGGPGGTQQFGHIYYAI